MYKKGILYIFILSFLISEIIFSEHLEEVKKIPVDIKAEKLIYIPSIKTTIAKENVIVKYKDIEIASSYIEIDEEAEVIYAQGNIKFKRDEQEISAHAIKYDVKNEEGVLYFTEGKSEPFYFEGERMKLVPKKTDIANSQITTCNLKKPHYKIEGEKVDIYAEDKLVAKKIKFYLLGSKIFYFPIYVVSLKEKEKQPFAPKIGYNKIDGLFVKTTYNYYLNLNSYGSLYLDWVEKKGTGYGLRQNFNLKNQGKTSIYLYRLREPDPNKTSFVGEITHLQSLTKNISLSSDVKYNNQRLLANQEIDTLDGRFKLERKTKNQSTTNTFNYRKIGSYINQKDYRVNILDTYQYKHGISHYINLDYSENQIKKKPANQELNTKIDLKKISGDGNTTISYQKRFDVDKDKNIDDRFYSAINKRPEVIFQSRRLSILPASYSLLYGRYEEIPKKIDEDKFNITTNIDFQRRIGIATLNLSNKFSQDFYSTGEAKYQVTVSPNLLLFYTKNLTQNFSYNYQYNRGPTPFSFDKYSSANNIFSELRFNSSNNRLIFRTSTGYDFFIKKYQQLRNALDLVLSDEFKSSFVFEYDINRKKWGNLSGLTAYNNPNVSIKSSYLYDINLERFLRIDGEANIKILPFLEVQYKTSYNPITKKFAYNDFLILRDLHCWRTRIFYKHNKNEFFVEFNIKAFPSEKLLLGVDESGIQYQASFINF